MTDQTTPEAIEDDDEITVGFVFHNPTGTGDTVLSTPLLGLDLYILIRPGEGGPELESSHADPNEVAAAMSIVLAALLQADEVSDETRSAVRDMLEEDQA